MKIYRVTSDIFWKGSNGKGLWIENMTQMAARDVESAISKLKKRYINKKFTDYEKQISFCTKIRIWEVRILADTNRDTR